MTIEEINNIAYQIIVHAGDGKSYSMEAIEDAEAGDFESAENNLKNSEASIQKAHEIHTDLLVREARDPECLRVTMMLIHASNHLSVAELTRDLAERFLCVYKRGK